MLTATYSFVAINAEQKIARSILVKLKQYVQTTWRDQERTDAVLLETTLSRLTHFDGYRAARKLERYVIPAMRGWSAEVDQILDELSALSASATRTLTALYDTLRVTLEQGEPDVYEVVTAMESYCDSVAARFGMEQAQLFPLADRWLSSEAGFAIGTQFLSDDEYHSAHHRATPPTIPHYAGIA